MAALRQIKISVIFIVLPLLLQGCAGFGDFFSFLRPAKITWNDTSWCVPIQLKVALDKVARRFGPVTVHSTHRWPLENFRKGGKPRSYHLSCQAVDFSVRGNPTEVKRFLVSMWEVGGYSYYSKGFYHIDTGPRRTW